MYDAKFSISTALPLLSLRKTGFAVVGQSEMTHYWKLDLKCIKMI